MAKNKTKFWREKYHHQMKENNEHIEMIKRYEFMLQGADMDIRVLKMNLDYHLDTINEILKDKFLQ